MADPINVVDAANGGGLSVNPQPNTRELGLTMWGGEPDWDETSNTVMLRRPEVERLRDQLDDWLRVVS